ncbi:hypothetical protein MettiDRAFT_1862 [Methanolobus tindarius DSM 2278]|uniref:Uncharacterized protein n=1 Tax=Methanolobus tindarius DSM 2278 TaxID=1090322 RepID=W9DRL9_METTI|nr:hypothetical protein MettiDRAFT_1862 [Methanolobus tindarius DSM 2278]
MASKVVMLQYILYVDKYIISMTIVNYLSCHIVHTFSDNCATNEHMPTKKRGIYNPSISCMV